MIGIISGLIYYLIQTLNQVVTIKQQEWLALLSDTKAMNMKLNLKDQKYIYDNQIRTAQKVLDSIRKGFLNILVVGLPQSGKTGIIQAAINLIGECIIKNVQETILTFPVDNIYVITGLSSIEWVKQTKERFPRSIERHIFHRNDLNSALIDEIKTKMNVIIFIDECHFASLKGQSVDVFFTQLGKLNQEIMEKNNIRIIQLSATPNSVLIDLDTWGNKGIEIEMELPEFYFSPEMLDKANKVKQFYDLRSRENCIRLKKEIKEFEREFGKSIHIIRVNEDIRINLEAIYEKNLKRDLVKFITYFEGDETFDAYLENTPSKTTIIFIKEKLRCSKSILNKKHIGFVVELFSDNMHSDTNIQGLPGRMAGVYPNNILHKFIIYTDRASLHHNIKKDWNASSINVSKGKIKKCEETFSSLDPNYYKRQPHVNNQNMKIFDSLEEMVVFMKGINSKWRIQKKIYEKAEDERLKSVLGGVTKVRLVSEIERNFRFGLSGAQMHRHYPAYKDQNENTLVWCFCYQV